MYHIYLTQFPHIAPTAPTEDCVLTAPTGIEIENKTDDNSYEKYNISWDEPPCDVDSYTLYFTTEAIVQCQNMTLNRTTYTTGYHEGLKEIQMAAHLNDMTNCTEGMLSCNNYLII